MAAVCHTLFHGQESCGRQSRAISVLLDKITGFVPKNVTPLKKRTSHFSSQSPKAAGPQSEGVKIFRIMYTLKATSHLCV